jgi:invasion protein IalB
MAPPVAWQTAHKLPATAQICHHQQQQQQQQQQQVVGAGSGG